MRVLVMQYMYVLGEKHRLGSARANVDLGTFSEGRQGGTNDITCI